MPQRISIDKHALKRFNELARRVAIILPENFERTDSDDEIRIKTTHVYGGYGDLSSDKIYTVNLKDGSCGMQTISRDPEFAGGNDYIHKGNLESAALELRQNITGTFQIKTNGQQYSVWEFLAERRNEVQINGQRFTASPAPLKS